MADTTSGPVTPQELLAIAADAPPEIAGRIRRAADQLAATECPPSGAGRIFAERLRQVREEGYYWQRDDGYAKQELASAAACYAHPAQDPRRTEPLPYGGTPFGWPWDLGEWKPGELRDLGDGAMGIAIDDRIRELEKAGALCAAEIDRLVRLQAEGVMHV